MCSSDLAGTGTACADGRAANACTVTVNGDEAVTAVWKQQFDLTVTRTGQGTITFSGDLPINDGSATCLPADATCVRSFNNGDVVTVTADVDNTDDWTFVSIAAGTGTACADGGAANACTVTVNGDEAVTAVWKQQFDLTVTRTGQGTKIGRAHV